MSSDLYITRGEDFEHTFLYKEKKGSQSFGVNIEDYTIVWEVIDLANEGVYFTDGVEFSTARSNKVKGSIVIEMLASATDAIDEDLSWAPYILYIEDDANDKRTILETGTVRFQPWTRYTA